MPCSVSSEKPQGRVASLNLFLNTSGMLYMLFGLGPSDTYSLITDLKAVTRQHAGEECTDMEASQPLGEGPEVPSRQEPTVPPPRLRLPPLRPRQRLTRTYRQSWRASRH